jgi:hypothetical protein
MNVVVAGYALPGGLAASKVKVQTLHLKTVRISSDADGQYRADGLGQDYRYDVSVHAPLRFSELINLIRTPQQGDLDRLLLARKVNIRG